MTKPKKSSTENEKLSISSIDHCGLFLCDSVFDLWRNDAWMGSNVNKQTNLSYVFKVVVSFLQGSGSVKGFPNTSVFAEESFAVVFYPVHHLERERTQRSPLHHLLTHTQDGRQPAEPSALTVRSAVQNGLMNYECRRWNLHDHRGKRGSLSCGWEDVAFLYH